MSKLGIENRESIAFLFPKLSNASLLEAYEKALELNLNEDFIQLLQDEIRHRKLA